MDDVKKYPLPKFHYPQRARNLGPRQMPKATEKAQEPRQAPPATFFSSRTDIGDALTGAAKQRSPNDVETVAQNRPRW
jgi:hypothetical protein